MAGNQQEEIALNNMKKAVEKLGSSPEKQKNATLLRFLRARSMDPEKAAKLFVQWEKWREEFVPLGYIPESEVLNELEARKICLQGLSRHGFPVMIIQARKHFPSNNQLQFKRFVVHILDKTLASSFGENENEDGKMMGILDLQQIKLKNIDARGLITGFQFLQAYYPERLAKLFILNMPWIFVSVWNMVCRFLEKATQEKIKIVSTEEGKRDLIEEIGEETLPEEYGGLAKLVAMQDVKLSHWPLKK